MALVSSFKQQCPSCEAMVSIKENMVGKKVECNKCKDKFIAKMPDEDEDDFEEEEEVSAKKSKKVGAAAGKGSSNGKRPKLDVDDEEDAKPRSKNKSASNGKAKRADDDEDEDDDGPSKKKNAKSDAGSNKLVLGLGLAVVGIIILVVAAFFIMGNRTPKGPTIGPGGPGGPGPDEPPTTLKVPSKIDLRPQDPVAVGLTETERAKLTNLLPKDTEHVFHVFFDNLFAKGSTLRNAVFETPGALDDPALLKKLGFSTLAIDDMICAERYSAPAWRYTVIHFKDILKESDLKSALGLESVSPAVDGQTYFKFTKPHAAFDQLARFSFGIPNFFRYLEVRNDQATFVRLHNPQTLIVGDQAPMLAFLKAKGQFDLQTPRTPAAPAPNTPPTEGAPMPKGTDDGPTGKPKRGGAFNNKPGYRAADGTSPVAFVEAEQEAQPPGAGSTKPSGTWEGTEDGSSKLRFVFDEKGGVIIDSPKTNVTAGNGNWSGDQNKITITSPASNPAVTYEVSIDSGKMTGMAKTNQETTWPVELTQTGAGTPNVPAVSTRDDTYLSIRPSLKAMLDKMESRPSEKDKLLFSSATDMDANTVDAKSTGIRNMVVRKPRQFWDVTLLLHESKPRIRFLGTSLIQRDPLKFQLRNELACGLELDAKEFKKELTDRTAHQVSRFIFQLLKHEVKVVASVEKKETPKINDPQPPPGTEPEKKMDEKKSLEPTTSQITVDQAPAQANTVEFVLDLLLDNQVLIQTHSIAALNAAALRVEIDAAANPSVRHLLAGAGKLAADKGLPSRQVDPGQFLPGAFPSPTGRLYTDKEPRNRISWMAGLLPYLGQQTVYDRLNFGQSWRDSSNWLAGSTTVPQFLDPMYPDYTRQTSVNGLPFDFGATHFVGIAGVGLDAASYKRNDPATDHKRGVFSYDGSATIVDVMQGRGLANTIFMIQAPYDRGAGVSPWVAGGGATLRGVPEKNSIEPFILGKDRNGRVIQHESKPGAGTKGTYALMSDGSIRFIGENVSDEVFKAMCTLGGPAPADFDVRKNPNTPLIPPPDGRSQLPSVPTPPKVDPPKKTIEPEDPFKAVEKKEPPKKTDEENPFKSVDKKEPAKKSEDDNPFKSVDKKDPAKKEPPKKSEDDNPFKSVDKKSSSRLESVVPNRVFVEAGAWRHPRLEAPRMREWLV